MTRIKTSLKAINFFHFAYMGVFFKFFAMYLLAKGFDNQEIAMIHMTVSLTHIAGTFTVGYIANKFRLEERFLKIFTLLSFISFSLFILLDIYLADVFMAYVLLMALFAFFRNPILPLVDSATLDFVTKTGEDYGRIKLWGSLGFIFGTVIIGFMLNKKELFPISIILYGMCFFLFLSYLWSTRIPVKVTEKRAISLSLLAKSMKNRGIILIFLTSFLHIVGMAAYHVFFGVFITDRGYAPGYVGIFTVASVFSEVILFHFSAGILRKFSPYILLSVTFLFTALRWFVLSEYSEFWPVILSQTIHSLSWGLFFIVSINYINHHFKELLRTSGVTLFSTLVFGVGNLLGFFLAGTVSKYYGYSVLFFYCGILSLLTFSISLYLVSKEDSGFRLK